MGTRHGSPFYLGADFRVTGNPDPDCQGYYFEAGIYNGFPYYERQDSAYAIFRPSGPPRWHIDLSPGDLNPGFWERADTEGIYAPNFPYLGNPVVTAFS